jgi:hypothetical protein
MRLSSSSAPSDSIDTSVSALSSRASATTASAAEASCTAANQGKGVRSVGLSSY